MAPAPRSPGHAAVDRSAQCRPFPCPATGAADPERGGRGDRSPAGEGRRAAAPPRVSGTGHLIACAEYRRPGLDGEASPDSVRGYLDSADCASEIRRTSVPSPETGGGRTVRPAAERCRHAAAVWRGYTAPGSGAGGGWNQRPLWAWHSLDGLRATRKLHGGGQDRV